MKTRIKVIVSMLFCLATISSLCSFSRDTNRKCEATHEKKQIRKVKKMKKGACKEVTKQLQAAADHSIRFSTIAKHALDKGFPEKNFAAIVKKVKKVPLRRALQATLAIGKNCKPLALSTGEIFEMATFIETKMQEEKKLGKTYFSRRNTGLARSIQIDPATGSVFIHLKLHGVCGIGEGARKKITRSILYSRDKPEVLAHCYSSFQIDSEIQAVHDLRGQPGLYDVKALLTKVCKDGKIAHSMMTKYYSGGDLRALVEKNHKKLSLGQRLQFAHDILVGIESMHKNGYSHRDLGLRNYFVDYVGKGKNRRAYAVVGDLGRAAKQGKTDERGAQGGSSQLAPEAIAYDKLAGDDYLYTDIYALGCAFYRILHCEKAPWNDVDSMENEKIAVNQRINRAKMEIMKFWKLRSQLHSSSKKKKGLPAPIVAFENLIRKMVDPERSNRGTASELRVMLEKIMNDHHKALKLKKQKFPVKH